MAINLLNIQPHKVSRDLSGNMIYLYGPGGAGKTTFGAAAPKSLLLAFEKGYNALPGVMAQDMGSWTDMRSVVRELKKPAVKEAFSTVVVDTVDIASSMCEKYVCNQLEIENIGDGGWAKNGWAKVKKEWEEVFRSIAYEGYALIFISHAKDKTFTRKDGTTYNQVVPSCSTAYNEIIKNMVDIMGYISIENNERRLILRSPDDSVDCKCRFKYIVPDINFSYENLVQALNDAIDKEAEKTNNKFITNEKSVAPEVQTYDYATLVDEFQTLVGRIMESNQTTNGPKITHVVDNYLGKGKKVSETTPVQAELIYLINAELKDEFNIG